MNYILLNSKSHNGGSQETVKSLEGKLKGKIKTLDVITLEYGKFVADLKESDKVILVGGDGTLNHFVNAIDTSSLPCKFYFYAAGTGNDFRNDQADAVKDDMIYLNDIVKHLPTVTVNGKTSKFINGIGYGIDGYCCEVGDALQAKSDKPINYTSIAIKGLLFHYKPKNAKITVDGVTKEYKKVWLAPTMIGKYYGGGMKVTPSQDRFNKDNTVTNGVMYGTGKIKTLMVFPSIFKGEHVAHKEMFEMRSGHDIKVEFDAPCALQIDGETVLGVTCYEVHYN